MRLYTKAEVSVGANPVEWRWFPVGSTAWNAFSKWSGSIFFSGLEFIDILLGFFLHITWCWTWTQYSARTSECVSKLSWHSCWTMLCRRAGGGHSIWCKRWIIGFLELQFHTFTVIDSVKMRLQLLLRYHRYSGLVCRRKPWPEDKALFLTLDIWKHRWWSSTRTETILSWEEFEMD